MLYPFWGKPPEDPADPTTGRYDHYASLGSEFFRMVSLDEAEAAVFPSDWTHVFQDPDRIAGASRFAAEVNAAGKPTIVFFFNDSAESIPLTGAVVFRTSLYRSRQGSAEFAQPAWSEDFLQRYVRGPVLLRKRTTHPTVGFCGLAPGSRLPRLRRAHPDPTLRARALRRLRRTRGVHTNFVVREGFVGGAVQDGKLDTRTLRRVREEYVRNMLDSDYILCARGAGNFSYRLYETLSCGRIPVFIDTDSVLPYDFLIDWRKIAVWIDEPALPEIGTRVVEFHESLTDREFADLQRECRLVWEHYLRPKGFFENLWRHFSKAGESVSPSPVD